MRGSLLKRGETWSYVLYLGRGPDGKKQQKWVGGFRTRREAEAALTEALERVRIGTWGDPGRQTVGEYLEDWLTAVRPSLRSSFLKERLMSTVLLGEERRFRRLRRRFLEVGGPRC